MAQDMLPTGTAISSGSVMGLAWATGSVGVLGTGILGDVVGPWTATLTSMPIVLLAVPLVSRPVLRRAADPHRRGV